VKNVTVKDYNSLDEHPDLILYEGWFDKKSMKVQIKEKERACKNLGYEQRGQQWRRRKRKKKAQGAEQASLPQPSKTSER
jgi:hypothetical protein